jgi:predicted ATP-grasp superfamily ATP-dependent carboligase
MERILIAGASTRAAAESAARAGFAVTAIDSYADLDQHPNVRAFVVPSATGGTADALARAAAEIDADGVVYLSPFENHPRALSLLAQGRRLLGNDVDVLRRVRDPRALSEAFRARGFDAPRVVVRAQRAERPRNSGTLRWLMKPTRSGGGHGVQAGDVDEPLSPGWYLQEHIDGWPGSVTFVAAKGRCAVLAVSRQLAGDPAFGAEGYRYCGNLVAWTGTARTDGSSMVVRAHALAQAAAEAFDLVGVNGIDFVVRDGVPVPIEINPRWSSSMELVDRAASLSVMAAHIQSCHGSLIEVTPAVDRPQVTGKAIVFARGDVVMPDTVSWLGDRSLRDVPQPRQRIARGQPICTVFAEGPTGQACRAGLVDRAAEVYERLAMSAT